MTHQTNWELPELLKPCELASPHTIRMQKTQMSLVTGTYKLLQRWPLGWSITRSRLISPECWRHAHSIPPAFQSYVSAMNCLKLHYTLSFDTPGDENLPLMNTLRIALETQLGYCNIVLKSKFSSSTTDIMILSETCLTNCSFFRLPYYASYYTCHPDNRAHANTAVINCHTTLHFELDLFSAECLQVTSTRVKVFKWWSNALWR